MTKKLSLANKENNPVATTEVEINTLSDKDHVRLRRGMYLPNMNT